MAASYTTLESVRESYMGTWDAEAWDDWVERQIPVVSAMLRQEFRNYSRDLDDEIALGLVDPILVEDVANSIIHRRLQSEDTAAPVAGDYSTLSASAGPYSFSGTLAGSTGSFYIKREERRRLGLSVVAMAGIDIVYGGFSHVSY